MSGAPENQGGTIVTFYSYKGGTGRSMALANAAWILASNNKRVLIVDWDLEAPGLHKYLHPFLEDKDLASSPGVINLVHEYRAAVLNHPDARNGAEKLPAEWYEQQADILRYATEINYPFDGEGALHFVPAGTQDSTYATLVNRFSWQQLFDSQGGHSFFEAIKKQMKAEYDYVLIDSRTGVSDTSGLCTVQLPDQLVVCFTLNNQSIEGASGVAADAFRQRKAAGEAAAGQDPPAAAGVAPLRIWPVPTRIELAEKQKADRARERARALFDPLMEHLKLEARGPYWGAAGILYQAFYAYEEILAPFGDQPDETHSMLGSIERLVAFLSDNAVTKLPPVPEKQRRDTLASFSRRPSTEILRALGSLASQYEEIRKVMQAGNDRTARMTEILYRVQTLVDQTESAAVAREMFNQGTDGSRVVGLAVALASPAIEHFDIAVDGIRNRRSPFEQYQALMLAQHLLERLNDTQRRLLQEAVQSQLGSTIDQTDMSRWVPSQDILRKLTVEPPSAAATNRNEWARFAPAPRALSGHARWHVFLWASPDKMLWARSVRDLLTEHGWLVFMDQPAPNMPPSILEPASRAAVAESMAAIIVGSNRFSYEAVNARSQILAASADPGLVVWEVLAEPGEIAGGPTGGLDLSAYPDGLTSGGLLRLLYLLSDAAVPRDAARFATEQDEAAQEAGAVIGAAIRNGTPGRILELFERGGLIWDVSPTLACRAAEALIKLDRNDEAIQILVKVSEQFPKTLRPKQLHALALARRGAMRDLMNAQDVLGTLYERGERDAETLGIYARTWKSRYYLSGDSNDLREARDLYAEAQQLTPTDYYTAINVASTSVLLGTPEDVTTAISFADIVLSILGPQPPAKDFWAAATIAEAWLIKGDYRAAARAYEAAVRAARLERGSHESVWKQACSLMKVLNPGPEDRAAIRKIFAHLPDCEAPAGTDAAMA